MKRFQLIIILLITASFGSLAQPALVIKDHKKNFGMVKKGEVVRIEYDITNVGNEPLIIKDMDIPCSCTTAEFERKPITPGSHSRIIVSFDTKTVYDRQDRTLMIQSNDPKGPHKIRFKGVVLNK